jgi:hypothetical protein
MVEAVRTSETSIYVNEPTRRYISESCQLQDESNTRFLIVFKMDYNVGLILLLVPSGFTTKMCRSTHVSSLMRAASLGHFIL